VHEKTRAGDLDIGTHQTVVDTSRQIVRRGQRLAAKNLAVVIDGNKSVNVPPISTAILMELPYND
jgi:hypothetical protein